MFFRIASNLAIITVLIIASNYFFSDCHCAGLSQAQI